VADRWLHNRIAQRNRTLLSGIVLHGPQSLTLDCTVRDLSTAGARIRLAGQVHILPLVALLVPTLDQAFAASSVWRREQEFGLSFLQAIDFQAPTSDLARTVRLLWLERRRR
jgi:hypothetical protein